MEQDQDKDKFDQGDLPQEEVFQRKEVFQYPQPADQGIPLHKKDDERNAATPVPSKQTEKTSAEEGLNEANSPGTAGAFEGFEDQGDS